MIEKYSLKNGIRVLHFPLTETKVVTALCIFGTGSRYENKKQNGLSHYLEHLFFKGTKKRPSTLKIAQELDSLGAEYNAFTSEEATGYFVECENKNFLQALDVLADLLKNPLFERSELEREKKVICEEINMYQDMPQRYVCELAKLSFFGDTPLGRDIAGTKKNVKSFTKNDLLRYKDSFYHTGNMHIIVAGNTKNINLKELLEEYFSPIKKKTKAKFEKIKTKAAAPKTKLLLKKTDQAHLVLGFLGVPYDHNLKIPAALLATILGGGMSSRLFIGIRERRGLAYYVKTDSENFHDTGLFVTQTGVMIEKIEEAIKVILDEYQNIKKDGVTPEELKKAKNQVRGKIVIGAERSEELTMFLGGQAIYRDKILTPEELLCEIEKITSSDLKQVTEKLFIPQTLNLAIIGPYKDERKFDKIISSF